MKIHKDGRWDCPKCGHENYSNSHGCGSCLAYPPRPKGKYWVCRVYSCGMAWNLNSKHAVCRICKRGKRPKIKTNLKNGVIAKMKWWNVLKAVSKASDRMMLVGPPGTGKSQTSFLLLGSQTQRLTMTEGTGVEDILGMFHLVKGETVWKDGPAARAMRAGTAIIIDEIDKYSPEVGSLLYALLDDDPQVVLPSGEFLKANAGYKVIATSNANVSALPEAILDRMEAIIIAAEPHPDAMEVLTEAQRGAVESHYRQHVSGKAWQWTGTATLRRMRAYAKFRRELEEELSEAVAAEAVFGSAGAEMVSVLATAARRKL